PHVRAAARRARSPRADRARERRRLVRRDRETPRAVALHHPLGRLDRSAASHRSLATRPLPLARVERAPRRPRDARDAAARERRRRPHRDAEHAALLLALVARRAAHLPPARSGATRRRAAVARPARAARRGA